MFLVMSVLPFSAKNAFVTEYLLETSLASSVQKCRVLFQNWTELKLYLISELMSFKEGNELIELKENEKSTNVFTRNIS